MNSYFIKMKKENHYEGYAKHAKSNAASRKDATKCKDTGKKLPKTKKLLECQKWRWYGLKFFHWKTGIKKA